MRETCIKLLAVGDICLKKNRKSYLLSEDVKTLFSKHDVNTCDLGITLDNSGGKPVHKIGPLEQQIPEAVSICKKCNIGFVRLAGNHIMDFGIKGKEHLISELSEQGIKYGGVSVKSLDDAYEPYIYEKDSIRIAFFSVGEMCFGCLENREECGGYAWVNSHKLQERIAYYKNLVDYIIVFPHAGLEMVPVPMMEWRERYYTLIDYGADAVIATHSHIIQGVETYKKGIIAYSLGNFAYDFAGSDHENWDTSIGLSLKFTKDMSIESEIIPFRYVNQRVELADKEVDLMKHIKVRNSILNNLEIYRNSVQEYCKEYFEHYYYDYFIHEAVPITGKINYSFLWHNIAIESAGYMLQNALYGLMEEESDYNMDSPYDKEYILWGYGKAGKFAEKFMQDKNINLIGIVDKKFENVKGFLNKEDAVHILKSNMRIEAIIATERYYYEIRDYLYLQLKRRQYIDFQHFMAWVNSFDYKNALEYYDN